MRNPLYPVGLTRPLRLSGKFGGGKGEYRVPGTCSGSLEEIFLEGKKGRRNRNAGGVRRENCFGWRGGEREKPKPLTVTGKGGACEQGAPGPQGGNAVGDFTYSSKVKEKRVYIGKEGKKGLTNAQSKSLTKAGRKRRRMGSKLRVSHVT